MLRIKTDGCAKGYGYVVDYLGNVWFYGSITECESFIAVMNEQIYFARKEEV